jgi:chemotaxis protein methyltransferase WspC
VSQPFDAARRLADAGNLVEARKACEKACADHPGSADGYALLGAILQAEGNATAAGNAFRKALYLVPDHPDALAHLIVLAERRGDTDQAAALRRRLARLTTRGGTA